MIRERPFSRVNRNKKKCCTVPTNGTPTGHPAGRVEFTGGTPTTQPKEMSTIEDAGIHMDDEWIRDYEEYQYDSNDNDSKIHEIRKDQSCWG